MDLLKIGALGLSILISGFFYLRFVSLASTEGYFLRQANNDLNSISFQHEIIKTEVLEQKRNNREQMYGNNQSKRIVDIRPEIVRIPSKTELTYK
ncbi:MAG TPA: hypothetical protein P5060_00835 [Candidatus Absconditabacterales bacterium]|nr:hypothetical protein [Candidatus Absconditabacterales bacterium]